MDPNNNSDSNTAAKQYFERCLRLYRDCGDGERDWDGEHAPAITSSYDAVDDFFNRRADAFASASALLREVFFPGLGKAALDGQRAALQQLQVAAVAALLPGPRPIGAPPEKCGRLLDTLDDDQVKESTLAQRQIIRKHLFQFFAARGLELQQFIENPAYPAKFQQTPFLLALGELVHEKKADNREYSRNTVKNRLTNLFHLVKLIPDTHFDADNGKHAALAAITNAAREADAEAAKKVEEQRVAGEKQDWNWLRTGLRQIALNLFALLAHFTQHPHDIPPLLFLRLWYVCLRIVVPVRGSELVFAHPDHKTPYIRGTTAFLADTEAKFRAATETNKTKRAEFRHNIIACFGAHNYILIERHKLQKGKEEQVGVWTRTITKDDVNALFFAATMEEGRDAFSELFKIPFLANYLDTHIFGQKPSKKMDALYFKNTQKSQAGTLHKKEGLHGYLHQISKFLANLPPDASGRLPNGIGGVGCFEFGQYEVARVLESQHKIRHVYATILWDNNKHGPLPEHVFGTKHATLANVYANRV